MLDEHQASQYILLYSTHLVSTINSAGVSRNWCFIARLTTRIVDSRHGGIFNLLTRVPRRRISAYRFLNVHSVCSLSEKGTAEKRPPIPLQGTLI